MISGHTVSSQNIIFMEFYLTFYTINNSQIIPLMLQVWMAGEKHRQDGMIQSDANLGGGILGHTPSTAGTFRKKFRKNSGKTPETLSERFLEFPSRVRLGSSKPYNSRHLRLPEHFQNSLPPSTAGDASFFRSGFGEGLSELVMEFPAVLGLFLKFVLTIEGPAYCPKTNAFLTATLTCAKVWGYFSRSAPKLA